MIDANQIQKGTAFKWKGDPHVVTEFEFYKPGKGNSLTRTKMRNLKTGNVASHNFPSGEKLEDIQVSFLPVSFLYSDDTDFYFMDKNFEQFQIPKNIIAERDKYLVEEGSVDGIFIEDALFDIRLPKKMKFKVTEAPEGAKGDTANAATKPVKLETGAEVQAPLFIKEGEIIQINTETDEYVGRVNE